LSFNSNLEYNLLPYEKFTPFVFGGVGIISSYEKFNNVMAKFQYGGGFEYLLTNNFGIKIYGEQNLMFNDKLDEVIQGKRDDYFWRFGVGLNFYLSKPYKKVKSVIFE